MGLTIRRKLSLRPLKFPQHQATAVISQLRTANLALQINIFAILVKSVRVSPKNLETKSLLLNFSKSNVPKAVARNVSCSLVRFRTKLSFHRITGRPRFSLNSDHRPHRNQNLLGRGFRQIDLYGLTVSSIERCELFLLLLSVVQALYPHCH